MLKKTITYTDYNDSQRTDEFYFNLSKPELIRMQLGEKGGLDAQLQSVIKSQDGAQIMKFFEEIISTAYGIKSPDGREFTKSEELSRAFLQSSAYEQLYEELMSDESKAADFINAIIPKDKSSAITVTTPATV